MSKEEERLLFQNQRLLRKTVLLETMRDSTQLELGAGFIIDRGNSFFLVTNYHILSGRQAGDTNVFKTKNGQVPNKVRIRFHHYNNIEQYIPFEYDLFTNGRRNYPIIPADLHPWVPKQNEVTDLTFLLLKKIPNNILIDTVQLYDGIADSLLPKSVISIWGFRAFRIMFGHFPFVDTAITEPIESFETGYAASDKFVFYYSSKAFEGNSGAPVYIHRDTTPAFIGIHSASVGSAQGLTKILITKSFIKYAAEKYTRPTR